MGRFSLESASFGSLGTFPVRRRLVCSLLGVGVIRDILCNELVMCRSFCIGREYVSGYPYKPAYPDASDTIAMILTNAAETNLTIQSLRVDAATCDKWTLDLTWLQLSHYCTPKLSAGCAGLQELDLGQLELFAVLLKANDLVLQAPNLRKLE